MNKVKVYFNPNFATVTAFYKISGKKFGYKLSKELEKTSADQTSAKERE